MTSEHEHASGRAVTPSVSLDLTALGTALAQWLPERRWFQGKARVIHDVVVRGAVDLGADLIDVIAEVTYEDGGLEHYQVPLTEIDPEHGPGGATVLALPAADGSETVLTDALTRPATARRYAELILTGEEHDVGPLGVIRGSPVTPSVPELPEESRVLRGEQSNTSVVFGDSLILKVLRRLESGEHPDIEITRVLTEVGFPHIPPQVGSLVMTESGWPTALAVLTRFLEGGQDGWERTVAETTDVARGHDPDPAMLEALASLGSVVGELHSTLERSFPTQAAGPAELSSWSHGMREQLERVLALAQERTPEAAAMVLEVIDDLHAAIDDLQSMPLSEIGPMIRIHGDLHLGQTLLHPELGWQILDFEGEPARPVGERRQPSSPMRDVAGMVRSFDYAAAAGALAAGRSLENFPDSLVAWRESARRSFVNGYAKTAPDSLSGLDPNAVVVTAFELDKAIYELGYELANRPTWVPIPASGIVRAVRRYRDAAANRP